MSTNIERITANGLADISESIDGLKGSALSVSEGEALQPISTSLEELISIGHSIRHSLVLIANAMGVK